MKKVLSTIVASLVAVSFAGIVYATEPVTASTPAGAASAGNVAKPVKKHHKHHKRVKHHVKRHAKHHMKKKAMEPKAPAPAAAN